MVVMPIPALPFLNLTFDLTTVAFIFALIIFSVLSLCFIFHLRFKSKSLTHLQGFNSIWTVRFLLVLFIFFWAITELLRLPFFRRRYLYRFLPSFSISQQSEFCKLHVFFSLGFFEPAFLVTLLFLLNASTKEQTPNDTSAITFVIITCLPIATVQGLLLYFKAVVDHVPLFFRQTAVVINYGLGSETVLCGYPFLNSAVFAGFGVAYSLWFLVSCWRVLSLVINKGLRARIYALAVTVMVALPLQIVALGLTLFWRLDEDMYGVVSLVVFFGAFCCAVTGEGILVIKPISDALDVGGSCCKLSSCYGGGSQVKRSLVPEKTVVEGEGCV
ncbi:hypothetical protein TanjilG_08728 [Lupinus angustifolius]|uniref:THH1/TOM1/TOM3 domain-containing protein n=1 Tax=Lupinus angustifolius TaxID=3871 RepID=A0A4P1QXK1_LUPAN|nr:PREDICTED: uncharacterized protein LOC109327728 [Lupinus angustifolius]OIV96867.1 hypothetical protein TanjilG_08728 [Lupinus angustifolius]